MVRTEWIRCPVCRNKTRLQIRKDKELKNFPLYCPKCKQVSLIEVKNLQIKVIRRQKYDYTFYRSSFSVDFNGCIRGSHMFIYEKNELSLDYNIKDSGTKMKN